MTNSATQVAPPKDVALPEVGSSSRLDLATREQARASSVSTRSLSLGRRQVRKGKSPSVSSDDDDRGNTDVETKHNCPWSWTYQGRYCVDPIRYPRVFKDLCTRHKPESPRKAMQSASVSKQTLMIKWRAAGSCVDDSVCMSVVGPSRKDTVACMYLPTDSEAVDDAHDAWAPLILNKAFFARAELDIADIKKQRTASRLHRLLPVKRRIDMASVTATWERRPFDAEVDDWNGHRRSYMRTSRSSAGRNHWRSQVRRSSGQFGVNTAAVLDAAPGPSITITRVGDAEPLCATAAPSQNPPDEYGDPGASTSSGVCQPQMATPLEAGDQLDVVLSSTDPQPTLSALDVLIFDTEHWPDTFHDHGR